jgi:hypothetical protein
MTTSTHESAATDPRALRSFAESCPCYPGEHANLSGARPRFVGSSLALLCLGLRFATDAWAWLLAGLLGGCGFAWLGHFGVEKTARPVSAARTTASWATGSCSSTFLNRRIPL